MKLKRSLLLMALILGLRALPAGAESPAIDQLRDWISQAREHRPALATQAFAKTALTREDAATAAGLLWDDHVDQIKSDRGEEWDNKAITIGSHTLKLLSRQFGTKPAGGWNLFISMHGGGGAPKAVNDEQWQNQIQLYKPADSLYIAPRAPTDNWNLWHEAHIDPLFDRLIEDAVVLAGVNPDRVYLMGYSAGGDGVYQLAPRMADRFAAASMMAGHPNDALPLGLRNLPFTIHVGALDTGYGRNKIAGEWKTKLDDLQKADPGGYIHEVQLHEGREHWMNLEDAVAVDWMLKYTRNPIPDKVVWYQSEVTHDRFYWLARPGKEVAGKQLVIAHRDKQAIEIEKADDVNSLTIMFNDRMLDMDQPVTISSQGKQLFAGKIERTIASMGKTLAERGDPNLVFSAVQTVKLD